MEDISCSKPLGALNCTELRYAAKLGERADKLTDSQDLKPGSLM